MRYGKKKEQLSAKRESAAAIETVRGTAAKKRLEHLALVARSIESECKYDPNIHHECNNTPNIDSFQEEKFGTQEAAA